MRKIEFFAHRICAYAQTCNAQRTAQKGERNEKKMMAAVLIMAMTAGVLGGCGNSTGNNAKTDTNAQNNANTAEIKENANADVTEIANADGTVYKVGIVQYVDDASLNQIEKAIEAGA